MFETFHLLWWHWLAIGMAFLILEMLLSGEFMLWLGVSAFVMGVINGVVSLVYPGHPIPLTSQILLYGGISLMTLVVTRRFSVFGKKSGSRKDSAEKIPVLNRRAEQYIGRQFILVEPIQNGYGRIQVEDTFWRVAGPALPAGAIVKVVSVDGAVFNVVPT